ncbi:YlxR family protein [Raineyella antarctica]|uniref:YlxR family protein n=1 Tax=Raineyella antarctica TaxID=1577474 RepID=UPI001C31BDE3
MARPLSAHVPERTCIGCRGRSTKSGLVRLVWDRTELSVAVDPSGTAQGRGAWVHPDPHCCDLAMRRRAVGRALRVPDVDGEQVASLLASVQSKAAVSEGHHASPGQL